MSQPSFSSGITRESQGTGNPCEASKSPAPKKTFFGKDFWQGVLPAPEKNDAVPVRNLNAGRMKRDIPSLE
jgi:hypothetical protein